jgi:hypothetical protein
MSRSKISKFCKLDPAHLLDGLFVPVAKKGEALYDVSDKFDGGKISFKGCQLGASHQSVLLAVAARTSRAGKEAVVINCRSNDLSAILALKPLKIEGEASKADFSVVQCTAYSLLTDASIEPNGAGYKKLKVLLHELATVTLMRDLEGGGGTSTLLSAKWKADGTIFVTLNWRMTDAILGGQNIQISLHERHELGDRAYVAQILHAWLSGHIRLGGQLMAGRGAKIDTLIKHVWGTRPCSDDVLKKRRGRILEALCKIGNLPSWVCRIEGTHAFITRLKEIRNDDITPGQYSEYDRQILNDVTASSFGNPW